MTSQSFAEHLRRRAKAAGIGVGPTLANQLETYFRLLARWNDRINLTSLPLAPPTDEAIDRLLIEALAAVRHVSRSSTPWVDVGSGGGSPAIPMKMAMSGLHLTMVESKARKTAFLREAVRTLGLKGVNVETARIERLARMRELSGNVRLITTRAVRVDDELACGFTELLTSDGTVLVFQNSSDCTELPGLAVDRCERLLSSAAGTTTYLAIHRNVPRGT